MKILNMGPSARVVALATAAGINVVLSSGSSRFAIRIAREAAEALLTELQLLLPDAQIRTSRPKASSENSPAPDWLQIVKRLRAGIPTERDAEHIVFLLSHLGVRTND